MGFENGRLVRVTVRATQGSREQVNVFHYDLRDTAWPTDHNDPQSLADTFRDDVLPALAPLYRSSWTLQPVVVQDEKDPQHPTAPRNEWTAGTGIAGTNSSSADLAPPQQCAVAKWLTDHIGRRFNGRTFLGGDITQSSSVGGIYSSGILTLWEAYLNAIPLQPDISEGVSGATANLCVYSRTQRASNLDPYASHVTGHVLRHSAHWLRSRAD